MTTPPDKSGKNEVAAAYDRWAETYDTDLNRTRELAAAVLLQSNLQLAGRDVVEVGCGTGRNTEWLIERGASVLAVDFSEGMLRQAKSRVRSPRARFIRHDIRYAWPVAAASADLVIAMLVLEHIERVEPVFAEAARALCPGGELFVCELHPMRQMYGKQARFTDRETGECERIAAFLHDTSDYVNGALRSGFELAHLGEWRDADSLRSDLPRLLSLRLRLRAL